MSEENHRWVDALVSGLIIGCVTASIFIVKMLALLLLRCWDKYRDHYLMRGLLTVWAVASGLALSLALIPGGAALARWLALSFTIVALGGLAVSELILDYRIGETEAADEELTHHLGPWWRVGLLDGPFMLVQQPTTMHAV
jgi:hypothetical protein